MTFDASLARATFERDGVVFAPAVLDARALADALAAYEWSLANPGPGASRIAQATDALFYQDLYNPDCLSGYRDMLRASPLTTLVAGLFTWLMGYRLIAWRWKGPREIPTGMLLALSIAAAALTFAGEAIGIAIGYSVSPLAVLQTAFDFDWNNLDMVRPGWYVLAAGLVVVGIDIVCARWRKRRPRKATPARAPVEPVRETV